jgi:cell division protein FtsQ
MAWFRKKSAKNHRNRPPRPRREWNWRLIGRRVARTAIGAALVAAAGFGMVRLLDPQTLPLRALEVAGEFRQVSAEQVREIVAPYTGHGFFAVDVTALKRELHAMPWVYAVTVRREWPETLHVTVFEQVALARWGDDAVVSHLGTLFFPTPDSVPDDLPQLLGPAGSEGEVAAGLRLFSAALLPLDMQVRRLRLDERRSWQLVTDSDLEILLGRQDIERRINRFVGFYADLRGQRKSARLARVDLRYGNGFAVNWVEPDSNSVRGVS